MTVGHQMVSNLVAIFGVDKLRCNLISYNLRQSPRGKLEKAALGHSQFSDWLQGHSRALPTAHIGLPIQLCTSINTISHHLSTQKAAS